MAITATVDPYLELESYVAAARRRPIEGMAHFVTVLRENPTLRAQAEERLATYATFSKDRLGACWITRTSKDVLSTALARAAEQPDVPGGETTHV